MIDEPIGAALNKDIVTGEKVGHELDAFVRKRDKEGRRTEGERPEEEARKESVRRYEAARDATPATGVCEEYHTAQAVRHRALSKLSWHITRLKPRSIYRNFNSRIPESVSATTEAYRKEHKVTITEKLQNNHASFSRKAPEIRAEWTHSDASKRQELEGLYTEARSTHEQLTSQYRKDLSERLQKTRLETFSTRIGKDPALDVLVYRGALDRISKTRDTRELTHPRACPHDRRRAPYQAAVVEPGRGYEGRAVELVRLAQTEEKKGL